MAEVKWIKLNTNMFDDEKIKLIERMPDSDTVLVIWIKLLSQAGKTNASGYIYLNENIPYTDEMLAAIFNRPLMTVQMALNTFKQFGMIDIDENDFISIENWDKHQNVDGMERIKELNRKRVAKHREKKKLELGNVHGNEDVTLRNAIDIELDIDIERDKDISKTTKKTTEKKITYAEMVKMTPTEYSKLVEKHGEPATKAMIEILDNYKGSSGKKYASDYRAILSWVIKRYQQDNNVFVPIALKQTSTTIDIDMSDGEG